MVRNEKNKPNNYLNEYSYKQLKIANKIAWGILEEYIYRIRNEIISYAEKYITNQYQVNKLLKSLEFLGERNYQLVNYCFDLSVNEVNIRNNGTREIYRYYYKDAGTRIFNAVYFKDYLLKSNGKKMLRYLTAEGKKERDKIKDIAIKKFKKLQEELFFLVDNDPTVEDTEVGTTAN